SSRTTAARRRPALSRPTVSTPPERPRLPPSRSSSACAGGSGAWSRARSSLEQRPAPATMAGGVGRSFAGLLAAAVLVATPLGAASARPAGQQTARVTIFGDSAAEVLD